MVTRLVNALRHSTDIQSCFGGVKVCDCPVLSSIVCVCVCVHMCNVVCDCPVLSSVVCEYHRTFRVLLCVNIL